MHNGVALTGGHIGWALIVALVAFALAVWSVWMDTMPKIRVWLIVIVGTAGAGYAGGLEALAASSATTNRPIAAGIAIVVGVFFACELWRVAHPQPRLRALRRMRFGPHSPGGQPAGNARSRRIIHSAMALIAPTAFLAAFGVFAVVAGYGTAAVTQVASSIVSVI